MIRGRRERAAALLGRFPLRPVVARLSGRGTVVVLNYHRVGDGGAEPWDRTLWSATADELDAQLRAAARSADVIGPDEILDALDTRRGRHVMFTFDDGYRDNYETAFPVLRGHGVRAAFFLTTGFLDEPRAPWWDETAWMVNHADGPVLDLGGMLPGPLSLRERDRPVSTARLVARYKTLREADGERFLDRIAEAGGSGRCPPEQAAGLWMTWDMARELRSAGMSIGGHTVTHPVLARLSVERQREEIETCARRLDEEMKLKMTSFAYPVGSRDAFTDATKGILRECGVEVAFTFHGGYATPSRLDPLAVPRIHVGPGFTPRMLEAAVDLPRLFARR